MWLKNVFLKTVRDYRRSILIWGGGLALLMVSLGPAYNSLFAGPDRAKLIEDYKQLADAFSLLTGKANDVDTFGGFVTSRFQGSVPVLLSIFALLAGSNLMRGEEERGTLDVLLTTPHSRASVFLQKWAGLLVALLGIGVIGWLGLLAGAASSGVDLNVGLAALAFLDWAMVALVFGTLALLLGQVMSRRAAASWTGGFMSAAYLLNNLAGSLDSLQGLRYFSPFYYDGLSKPLAVSVGVNAATLPVMFAIMLVLLGVALAMYLNRDQNNYFHFWQTRQVVRPKLAHEVAEPRSFWLANSFTFGLRLGLPGALGWGLAMAAYEVVIISVLDSVRSQLTNFLQSDLYKALGFAAIASNENLLSILLFVFLVVIYAAYAVTQVAGWSSEENEGRLELVLSTPEPRWRLLVSRFLVSLLCSAVMVAISGLAFGLAAGVWNVTLNANKVFDTFFGLWVICLIIAAVGFGLAAFGPGWATAVTGGLVVVSYFLDLLAPVFKLPEWVQGLSVFHQYGRPLVSGLNWQAQSILLALSLVLVLVAAFQFTRRDIVK